MAAVGNHGIIIPRNKKLLCRLYWTEQKTLPEIASMFGVNHKSVLSCFRVLGIPTRRKGQKPKRGCVICGAPVFKIKHAGNGAMYGRRCKQHWNKHRNALAKAEAKTPVGAERKQRIMTRWYYEGPLNPQGESQWLSKGRSLLRTAKRYLTKPETRAAFRSQKTESEPEQISRI